jgi:predicted negative regulator of RcsB-dependent stress response
MKWAKVFFAAASVVFISAQTSAPSELMTHYRAYRAAFEAGDLATAETEAAATLQASVARDGEGGRTGVLALNLAQVRLQRGRVAEAYAPALQAFTIASARPDAGVDPLLARLVLGRSEPPA